MSPVLFLSGNHQRRLGHKVRPAITLLEATCHDCRDRVKMQILSTVVLFMCWIFLSSSCCEQGGAKQWITKYWYDCILMFRTMKSSFHPMMIVSPSQLAPPWLCPWPSLSCCVCAAGPGEWGTVSLNAAGTRSSPTHARRAAHLRIS